MIAGTIVLEDLVLNFSQAVSKDLVAELEIEFTITDTRTGNFEKKVVPQANFFKALSIAVHNDGEPDFNKDYPDAESVMGDIRWIP